MFSRSSLLLGLALVGCSCKKDAPVTEAAAASTAAASDPSASAPAASAASSPSAAAPPSAASAGVSVNGAASVNDVASGEPVIEGAPTAKDWAAAREVVVRGSSAVGCETKQSGEWFRMVCRPNDATGKAKSAAAVRGLDPKKGYLTASGGEVRLLTPYVRGSEIAIDIAWERRYGRLTLKWPRSVAQVPSVHGQIVARAASAEKGTPAPAQLEDTPPETTLKDALFVIYDEQGKHGFIDASGKVVIKPQFDEVARFEEGLAAFRQGDRWGFIDRTGKIVIPPQWVDGGVFSEGLAAVVKGEKVIGKNSLGFPVTLSDVGYIDRSGKYVIESRWCLFASDFSSGLANIVPDPSSDEAKKGRAYYVLRDGSQAFPSLVFVNALPFTKGFALVTQKGSDGKEQEALLDTKGALVSFPPGVEFDGEFSVDHVLVHIKATDNYGLMDRAGKLVPSIKAEELYELSEGLAVALVKGKYGYIRPDGTWAIPPKYVCTDAFSDGVARVCDGDPEDERYINAAGRVVILAGMGTSWGYDWAPTTGGYYGGLQYRNLSKSASSAGWNRSKREPDSVYGYRNKAGKYVWVSPNAESLLEKSFWKDHYVGPPRGP